MVEGPNSSSLQRDMKANFTSQTVQRVVFPPNHTTITSSSALKLTETVAPPVMSPSRRPHCCIHAPAFDQAHPVQFHCIEKKLIRVRTGHTLSSGIEPVVEHGGATAFAVDVKDVPERTWNTCKVRLEHGWHSNLIAPVIPNKWRDNLPVAWPVDQCSGVKVRQKHAGHWRTGC